MDGSTARHVESWTLGGTRIVGTDERPLCHLGQFASGAFLLTFFEENTGARAFALRFEEPADLERWAHDLYEISRGHSRSWSSAGGSRDLIGGAEGLPKPVKVVRRETHSEALPGASSDAIEGVPFWRFVRYAPGARCDLELLDGKGAVAFALSFGHPEGIYPWMRRLEGFARAPRE